jgi:hypothetical protein
MNREFPETPESPPLNPLWTNYVEHMRHLTARLDQVIQEQAHEKGSAFMHAARLVANDLLGAARKRCDELGPIASPVVLRNFERSISELKKAAQ